MDQQRPLTIDDDECDSAEDDDEYRPDQGLTSRQKSASRGMNNDAPESSAVAATGRASAVPAVRESSINPPPTSTQHRHVTAPSTRITPSRGSVARSQPLSRQSRTVVDLTKEESSIKTEPEEIPRNDSQQRSKVAAQTALAQHGEDEELGLQTQLAEADYDAKEAKREHMRRNLAQHQKKMRKVGTGN